MICSMPLKISRFAFVASAAMLAGCDWFASPSRMREIPVFDVDEGFVLAKVNGESVTAGDFRKRHDVEGAIYRHTNKKSKSVEKLETSTVSFMAKRNLSILAELVNHRLVQQYISSNKICIPGAERESFLARCLAKLKFKGGTVQSAASELGVDAKYLEGQLLVPLQIDAARTHFAGGSFTVTEKEVDEGLARQDRYYERAVASNATVYATASNTLKAVTAPGVDFANAGLAYGEYERDEAKRWDRMEYDEIAKENKAMADWAFKAPVGSIGGPFELDDGLSIVKILDRNEGMLQNSSVAKEVADVTLARITYHLVVPEPEPRTREFVRETLANWKKEQAQKGLFDELHSEMKLEYPNGTNFVFSCEAKGGKK